MTQEEKSLLLKDLCARLPYDVIVRCYFVDGGGEEILDIDDISDLLYYEENSEFPMYKPYLRPMSSMSEEEKNYISEKCGFSIAGPIRNECELIMPVLAADWLIDFYNERHFDYRGLIEKGLAIEAPEDMYK